MLDLILVDWAMLEVLVTMADLEVSLDVSVAIVVSTITDVSTLD